MDTKQRPQTEHSSEKELWPSFGQIYFNKWKLTAFVIFGLFAVFYLPSFVPLSPSVSDSYVFGYNNRVGVVLIVLLTTIAVLWTRGMGFRFSAKGDSEPIPLTVLFFSLITVLCGCVLMYSFAGRYGGFSESAYEIDRAWLLSQGRVPYVDFEFAYGPSFLYGPVLFQHLLSIDIASAYYIFWIFLFSSGSVLLFINVNMINYPSHSKLSIFLLLFIPGLFAIECMGINYAPFRFTCPIFFILLLDRVARRRGISSQVYSSILAIAFTIALLSISPETAIAFAFASICIFQCCSPDRGTRFVALRLGLLSVYALIFWTALKLHLLDTLKADAGGADSFPITFAPHLILFFVSLFFCACYVYVRFSEHRLNDNTLGLIAYSIPMLAAALGRCDPGHVGGNGTGIIIASLFYASNHEKLWRSYKFAFITFMCVIPNLSGLLFYSPSLQKVSNLNSLSRVNPIDLNSIYPFWRGGFFAPFAYKPNGVGNFHNERVDYGHFEPLVNENTVAAINEKLSEMKNHPEKALLLPEHFEHYCAIYVESERVLISVLFAFPYFGKAVHTEGVRRPICDYIQGNYRLEEPPTAQNFNYELWVSKSMDNKVAVPH